MFRIHHDYPELATFEGGHALLLQRNPKYPGYLEWMCQCGHPLALLTEEESKAFTSFIEVPQESHLVQVGDALEEEEAR